MLKKILFLLLLSSAAFADTHYISPTGNDVTGDGTDGNPWATLKKAFPSMSGGDTLIVKDGVYTGQLNAIGKYDGGTVNATPPYGSPSAWTIIKAEHDGMAIFDGETTTAMFFTTNETDVYWQFEGLVWRNTKFSNVGVYYSNYIKFLRCGAYDAPNGNAVNFSIGRSVSYVLMENCYAYGNGRYKFMVYQSTAVVLRQCVGRLDKDDAKGEPVAVFSIYSCDDVEIQNCIAIDTDQTESIINIGDWGGGFYIPATDMAANRNNFRQCVSLNVRVGGLGIANNGSTTCASDILFDNCVFWDNETKSNSFLYNARGPDATITNCTFGNSYAKNAILGSYDYSGEVENNTTISNCIIYHSTSGAVMQDVENENYNCIYDFTKGHISEAYQVVAFNANDITDNCPLWSVSNSSGALKYPVRTESGNSLATKGAGGTQIGANALTLVGVPGTLYGETGYATDTGVSMWPYPNESFIESKMAEYSSGTVSGDRGFASTTATQLDGTTPVTLTSYIWEYLGNRIPVEIYNKPESEPEILTEMGLTISGGLTITGGIRVGGVE